MQWLEIKQVKYWSKTTEWYCSLNQLLRTYYKWTIRHKTNQTTNFLISQKQQQTFEAHHHSKNYLFYFVIAPCAGWDEHVWKLDLFNQDFSFFSFSVFQFIKISSYIGIISNLIEFGLYNRFLVYLVLYQKPIIIFTFYRLIKKIFIFYRNF